MSDFVDALVDLLPEHNSLKRRNNPLRQVLDKSVGEWFDQHSVQRFYDNLFLQSATGGWLDLHGRDYGVYRRIGESDEDYRRRIVFEKLDYLTTELLLTVYGVGLFSYRMDFDLTGNTLVSDNVYLSEEFIGVSDNDTISILDKKYVLDTSVTWVNSDGEMEYIFDVRGMNVLPNYSEIYRLQSLVSYFMNNESIENVKLKLPTAIDCSTMFGGCSALTDVKLNLPNLSNYTHMFDYASNIETIDVTIPTSIVNSFKSYVLGLNLENLTSFIINGEEVDLT